MKNKFDERKRDGRAREEERWQQDVERAAMPGWKRAVLVTVKDISDNLQALTREALETGDESKRKEIMRELQALKCKLQSLRSKII
jgi:hypothetical protein